FYAQFWTGGGAIGFGIVACIYVHEIGHVAALQRYGIDASAPMFIPGFGALVRLRQNPKDAHEDAQIGLAGPLWGLFASCVAAIRALAHSHTATAVASWSATVNLFNMIPVWQLDGARGIRPMSQNERIIVACVAGALGFIFHQWMPIIVAGLTFAMSFAKDLN